MTNIATLFICLVIGIVLRATRRLPDDAHLVLNGIIIQAALPALIIHQLHGMSLTTAQLLPASMPWLLFGVSFALFATIGRMLRLNAGVTGALVLTAGLANTSFVGLPMIETFYGRDAMATGILIDQFGTYLVLSTVGVVVACLFSSETVSARAIVKRIMMFPPLIALAVAIVTSPITYPGWLQGMLLRLGDTLAPLALLSVGLQLRLDQFGGNRIPLGLGLGYKLVLGPLLMVLLYCGILSWRGEISRVTIFEAAMGPQIGGAIVAMQYGLKPSLITLMVGVGIVVSFATLPLWYLGLGQV